MATAYSALAANARFPGHQPSCAGVSRPLLPTGSCSNRRASSASKLNLLLAYGRCSNSDGAEPQQELDCLDHLDDDNLRFELEAAVKAEQYAKAATLRDLLRTRQDDNLAGLLAANARFYKAFETGDFAEMRRVWSKGDNVHCVHPGSGCISGYELVMSSWEVMLGPEVILPLCIELQDLEARVKGGMGFITCLEVVKTPGTSWGRQVVTNVFEKEDDGVWRICMHHASYGPELS